jgi:hypothetical protein
VSERIVCRCLKCRKETQVFGSRWCAECHYPSIDQDWKRFEMLVEEGYPRYQALLMAGLADPSE